jgi:hypothetical protein
MTMIQQFDQTISNAHLFIRARMPMTYLAYRSVLPKPGDDLVTLICKVADLTAVVFLFSMLSTFVHPALALLPFSFSIIDGFFLMAHAIDPHRFPLDPVANRLPLGGGSGYLPGVASTAVLGAMAIVAAVMAKGTGVFGIAG